MRIQNWTSTTRISSLYPAIWQKKTSNFLQVTQLPLPWLFFSRKNWILHWDQHCLLSTNSFRLIGQWHYYAHGSPRMTRSWWPPQLQESIELPLFPMIASILFNFLICVLKEKYRQSHMCYLRLWRSNIGTNIFLSPMDWSQVTQNDQSARPILPSQIIQAQV